LTAPGGANANGVYLYGSAGFPTDSWNSSNYWVDLVFTRSALADTTPPGVVSHVPVDGATGVVTSGVVSATFSEAVSSSSIVFTVKDGSGSVVAGSVAYDGSSRTATFTPSGALAGGTAYTASVSASDTSGNVMPSPVTWSFTTAGGVSCPCMLFASDAVPAQANTGDPSAVSLGVKFVPSVDGYVTGVRFYKSLSNTGTHTGTLWSASGAQLATGTFTGETASGWQSLQFASPVAVTGGTTYVVSYFAPNGHYADNQNFFTTSYVNDPLTAPGGANANGVYLYGSAGFPTDSWNSSNYWVDPIFIKAAP